MRDNFHHPNRFHPLAFPLCFDLSEHIFAKSSSFPFLHEEGGEDFLSSDRGRWKRWRTSTSPHPIKGDIYMIL
jgi:hypothetical protein